LINIAPDSKQLDPRYLSLFTQTKEYWDWIARTSTRSGQPGINAREYAQLRLPLPDIAIQHTIASAMADVDALIATLERLIAKKQAIKQGMLQQLLTGKTRLPGFTGQTESRRLSDISVKIQDGTHFSPQLGGSDFKYITSKNVGLGSLRLDDVAMISAAEHQKIFRRCDTKFGDLLITKDGASTGNVALNPFHEEVSLLSSIAFVRCDPQKASEAYILQYLLSYHGLQQVHNAMAGNAITRLTLAKIRNLVVPMPSIEEQKAAAHVLGDLDAEITATRGRLAKAKTIKQGMMQELLTGRTRLPDAKASV
jgi:type I restriction enzyme S subunit